MRRFPSNISLFAALAAVIILVVSLLPSGRPAADDGKLRIVCTFLPNYVFTQNVVGQIPDIDVRLLVSPDAGCPHGYVLSPADLKAVAQADVIVANGLGLEMFLDDLKRANPKARIIEISGTCDVLAAVDSHQQDDNKTHAVASGPTHEAHSPRVTAEAGHDEHAHDCDEDHDHDHEHAHGHHDESHVHGEFNPHVWVSPVQAIHQIRELARQLSQAAPEHATQLKANADAFTARIEALRRRMLDASAHFVNRRIVTFHDSFAYLARDLNLEIVATMTIEPAAPPSAQQLARIIDTIREKAAAAIFYEPAYSDAVARTISRDTGVPYYPLNPFNSLDVPPSAGSYEEVMEQNLSILKKALEQKP